MKINQYLPLAIASLAIAAGNTAQAGEQISQYSATPVTFSLIVNIQGEGDYSYSETNQSYTETYTAEVGQMKIGNLQILQALRDQGVINGTSGWSIVMVSSSMDDYGRDYEGGNSLVGFYLTKTGKEPIDISEYLGFELAGGTTRTGTSATQYFESYETTTESYNNSFFGALFFSIYEGYLGVFGNFKYKTLDTNTYYYESWSESTHSINSFNLSSASGFYGFDGPFGGYSLTGKITGSTISTPINIYLYQ